MILVFFVCGFFFFGFGLTCGWLAWGAPLRELEHAERIRQWEAEALRADGRVRLSLVDVDHDAA